MTNVTYLSIFRTHAQKEDVTYKQTQGKYKRNHSPRQVLAEELGYRNAFGCGGALRFAAIAF